MGFYLSLGGAAASESALLGDDGGDCRELRVHAAHRNGAERHGFLTWNSAGH